jgi:hypothetical protein
MIPWTLVHIMKLIPTRTTFDFITLAVSISLICGKSLCADVLFEEGFETDGLGVRYFATDTFTDGQDDYFIRTDGSTEASGIPAYSGFSGNYFWAAEDTDASDNPSGLSMLDFPAIDLGEFTAITISLDIGAGSQSTFDSIDDFVFVQYRIDAGSWTTALSFQNDGTTFNSLLQEDTDFDGIGDGTVLDLSLQTFSTSSIPVAGSFMDLRIDTVLNGGGEAVAFDSVRVSSVPEPAHAAFALGALAIIFLLCKRHFLPQREDENRA